MNLEAVEQKCLTYLKEVSNPLVAVDSLLRFLHRDPEMSGIDETELLGFLRKHELFRVVEPPILASDSQGASELAQAGIPMSPRVFLCTRKPTEAQMIEYMAHELRNLCEALSFALKEANAAKDEKRAQRIKAALQRARSLHRRIENMAGGSQHG